VPKLKWRGKEGERERGEKREREREINIYVRIIKVYIRSIVQVSSELHNIEFS